MFLLIFSTVFFTIISSQLLIPNTGPCECDLKENICDDNCCCDASCNATQFDCSSSFIKPADLACIDRNLLYTNNSDTNTIFQSLDPDTLCIYRDNYSLRNFYYSPSLFSNQFLNSTKYDSFISSSYRLWTNESSYKMGNPLMSFITNASIIGYLAISRPSLLDSFCIHGSPVGFLQSESTSCQQQLPSNAEDCSMQPSVGNFYDQQMVLLRQPNSLLLGNYSSTRFVTVQCVGSCQATKAEMSGDICNNVVISVSYLINSQVQSNNAVIEDITVTITTSNVSIATTGIYTLSMSVTFNQVGYSSASPSATKYSGNPGYLENTPIRSGLMSSPLKARLDYFPSSALCAPTTSSQTAMFMVNTQSTCFINASSLRNTSNYSVFNQNINMTYFIPLLPTYVTSYGNSETSVIDALVPRLWSTITASTNASSNQILSLTDVSLVYVRTGTLTSPQNKIIGYHVAQSYSQIDLNSTEILQLSYSVKFIDDTSLDFSLGEIVNKIKHRRSLREFFYLLYVENTGYSIQLTWINCLVISIGLSFSAMKIL